MDKQGRIGFINVLQVIGPILVILGHSLNGIDAKGAWYTFSKEWIYIFHMPFFFVISGYLLSKNEWMRNSTYIKFLCSKFMRLIVPYLIWNIGFIVPKYMAQTVISDEVTMNIMTIAKMFIYPRQNIWGHTWFLVGLFILYCFTPIWKVLVNRKPLLVISIIAGIILYMTPIGSEFLCMSDLHKDTLFFIIGCYMGTIDVAKLKQILNRYFNLLCVIAGATSVFALFVVERKTFDWIPCLAIILFMWSISLKLENKFKYETILAKRSFGIYILHWPIMLVVRVVMMNLLGLNSFLVVVMMIACGYLVPNIIIFVLQKIKYKPLNRLCKILIGC